MMLKSFSLLALASAANADTGKCYPGERIDNVACFNNIANDPEFNQKVHCFFQRNHESRQFAKCLGGYPDSFVQRPIAMQKYWNCRNGMVKDIKLKFEKDLKKAQKESKNPPQVPAQEEEEAAYVAQAAAPAKQDQKKPKKEKKVKKDKKPKKDKSAKKDKSKKRGRRSADPDNCLDAVDDLDMGPCASCVGKIKYIQNPEDFQSCLQSSRCQRLNPSQEEMDLMSECNLQLRMEYPCKVFHNLVKDMHVFD